MSRFHYASLRGFCVGFGVLLASAVTLQAEPVAVRYPDGAVHGFLALRAQDGKLLADGDLNQTVRGDRVTAHLVFRFKDGSVHEQTTVYSQRDRFRLISDRVVQKGPAFPQPLEMVIDTAAGRATVSYADGNGETKHEAEEIEMPPDLANGIVGKLLMNAKPGAIPKSLSFIAATPTPRLVKLLVSQAGREPLSSAGGTRQAIHYVLKVDIGGLAGVLAPVFGKQPPDSHVWIVADDVPAFVGADQPLYTGGPMWRIEVTNPVLKARSSPNARVSEANR
jgi:hypothetical protein